jgi:hypothetical protein
MPKKLNQALDNLTEQAIQTMSEALAEKDQIIQELRQKLAQCNCQEVSRV